MKLKYDELLSKFAFNFNMRPSNLVRSAWERVTADAADGVGMPVDERTGMYEAVSSLDLAPFMFPEDAQHGLVGRCTLTPGFHR